MSSSEFNWNGAFSDYNSQGMNRSRGLDSTVNNRQQPVGPWLLQSQADDYGIMHMGHGIHSTRSGNTQEGQGGYSQILANATEPDLLQSGNKAYINLQNEKMKLEFALDAQRGLVQQLLASRSQNMLPRHSSMKALPSSKDNSEDLKPPAPPEPFEQEDYPNVRFWKHGEWSKYINRQKEMGRDYSSMGWLTDEDGAEIADEVLKKMTQEAYGIFSKFYYHRLDPNTWRLRQPDVTAYFCNTMRTTFQALNLADGDWKAHLFAMSRYPNWNRYHRIPGHLKRKYPSLRTTSIDEPSEIHRSKKKKQKHSALVIDISDDENSISTSSTALEKKPFNASTSTQSTSGKKKPRHRGVDEAPDTFSHVQVLVPLLANASNTLPMQVSSTETTISPCANTTSAQDAASSSTNSATVIQRGMNSTTPATVTASNLDTHVAISVRDAGSHAVIATASSPSATTIMMTPVTRPVEYLPELIASSTGNLAVPVTSVLEQSSISISKPATLSSILREDGVSSTATQMANSFANPVVATDPPTRDPSQPDSELNSDWLYESNNLSIPEPVHQAPLPTATTNATTVTVTKAVPVLVSRQPELDLFNDLSIPEPAHQVPLQMTTRTDTTKLSVMKAAPTVQKKGKVMVPQADSVTARNLFAIDYMRQYPASTVTEFGKVWKHLDKETHDKYDAMSKAKGNEKRKAQKK